MAKERAQERGTLIEREIVRQTHEAFQVKDDWPQSLLMSMGVVFLLAGLGLHVARFVPDRPGAPRTIPQYLTAERPRGLMLLGIGAAFALLGYFFPMKRAK